MRPLFHGYCVAWKPSTCAYLSRLDNAAIFFGQPLTKAFREDCAIPNFHSASDRCREPHLVLCSLNAGQLAINLLSKA